MVINKDLLTWTKRIFQVGLEQEPRHRSFFLTVVFTLTLALLYQSTIQAQPDQRPIKPWVQEILEGHQFGFEPLAVKATMERGANTVFDELIPLLQHPDAQTRDLAATILGNLQRWHDQKLPDKALHGLLLSLSDPEYRVRSSASQAIATFGERAVPLLIKNLDDRNRFVRFWSVYTLGEIGPPAKEAVPSLINTYRTTKSPGYPGALKEPELGQADENDIHGSAFNALGSIWAGAESVPPFLSEQFDVSPGVSGILARVGEKAVPFLNRQLEHDSLRHRLAALGALFDIPNTEECLHTALKNSEAEVRYLTALKLGWRQEQARQAVPYLLPLLKDDVLKVRQTAFFAIASIGTTDYGTIAEEFLACADMEDGQIQASVSNFLQRAAHDDAANPKLIRILLLAYSEGGEKTQKALLHFFDLANFDQVEPILTRYSHDEQEAVVVAAMEILTRKRKAKQQTELNSLYFGPWIFYEIVSYHSKQAGFNVGYAIGRAVSLRNKFESRLTAGTLEFLR